jgi:ABC-type transporter Mla maintaining outer membrane lipid asymmetry ATPase subunit MlaF
VTISFDDFQVVDGVSLSIPTGRCTVIMGESGSGKSTLLKAAAGLIPADHGRVEILGVDLDLATPAELLDIRRRNGFVFQDAALWQNMSVFRNLALPVEFHYPGMDAEKMHLRIRELTGRLGFTDELSLRPAQLSSGEQKIISVVRALMLSPELLFVDEPTSFVDSRGIEAIVAELRRLKRDACTILTVTHDARIVSQLADFLIVLDEGRIIAFGPVRAVIASSEPRVRAVLADVLSETATYDQDLLGLLEIDRTPKGV